MYIHAETFIFSTDILFIVKKKMYNIKSISVLSYRGTLFTFKVYSRVLVYFCPIEDYAQCILHLH